MPLADQQPRQVVAGGGLARALRRLDDGAVGHHGGEVQHVLAHGAVAHRIGAGRAGGGHAADGGLLGAGVDGEEQPGIAQVIVELLARDARLHNAVEIALVDGEHPVHAREVDRQASARGVDVALQRGSRAERDDRHAMRAGHAHDLAHLLLVLDPDNRVRRLVWDPRDGVGMLAADLGSGLQPVSEALAQHGNRRGDTVCAATASCLRRHFHPCPSLECPDLRMLTPASVRAPGWASGRTGERCSHSRVAM